MKELWDRLGRVRESRLRVVEGDTRREGSGTVTIGRADPSVLEWEERGSWRDAEGRETTYSDRLRWTLSPEGDQVTLSHLRRGHSAPIHLGDLRFAGDARYRVLDPHTCSEDTYLAELTVKGDWIELRWHVQGPKKDYRMVRTYPSA